MEIIAFTAEQVCRLTGLSMRQLRYWDDTEFFSPTVIDDTGRRAFNRLYTFRDVVGLRTIAVLRKRLPLQELRRVGRWLQSKHEFPWSSLRLGVYGRSVAYFSETAGEFVDTSEAEQRVFAVVLAEVENEVTDRVEALRRRRQEDYGVITRNRYINHNKWVIAGTRVPVEAIKNLHAAGYSAEAILYEYPRLTAADIEAAISHEPMAA